MSAKKMTQEKQPHYSDDHRCSSVDSLPSLEDERAVGGSQKRSLCVSYNNIGSVLMAQGEYDRALKVYNQSLSIYKSELGEICREVADCYDHIGHVFQKMDKLDEALEVFEKALEIRERCSDPKEKETRNDFSSIHSCDLREPPSECVMDVETGTTLPCSRVMQDKREGQRKYAGQIKPSDVRFERGGGGNNHPGNKQYLAMVRSEKARYQMPDTSFSDKRKIAMSIIHKINERGGKFLTRDESDQNRYVVLAEDCTVKKVMQALRERPKELPNEAAKAQTRPANGLDTMAEAVVKVSGRRKATSLRGRPGRMHKPKQYVDLVTNADVLCERGGKGNNHPGNREYLDIVADIRIVYQHLPDTAKKAKFDLSMAVVDKIANRGGRFLELENIPHVAKRYYILSREDARVKVSQALRNKKKSLVESGVRQSSNIKKTQLL